MKVTVVPVSPFKQLSILMCKFKVIGRSILIFSGTILFLAGFLKLINVGAEDMIEGLDKAGLLKLRFPISVISIFCGVLLIIPKSSIVGVLSASAYWGGAIVAHLTYDDSFAMPAAFLSIMWSGWFFLHISNLKQFEESSQDSETNKINFN